MKMNSSYRTIVKTGAVMFVAVAAMFAMSQSASAQGCGYGGYGGGGYGGGGYGNYGGRGVTIGIGGGGFGGGGYGYGGYGRGLSVGYSSYRPNYNRSYYHNTSHLDYNPGRVVPHGNHLDYVPGHYNLHRTGHWHR